MSCNTLSAVTTMLIATQPNDTMRILTAIRALASVAVGEMRNASPDFEDTIPPAAPEITRPLGDNPTWDTPDKHSLQRRYRRKQGSANGKMLFRVRGVEARYAGVPTM